VKESVLVLFDVLPDRSHTYSGGHKNIQKDRLSERAFRRLARWRVNPAMKETENDEERKKRNYK
jgi:hypothetical protein